jgi:hypothetical protein
MIDLLVSCVIHIGGMRRRSLVQGWLALGGHIIGI